MPVSKAIQACESRIKRLQGKGYRMRGSFNSRSEASKLINNLPKWGYKVATVQFPNGVVIVFEKPKWKR